MSYKKNAQAERTNFSSRLLPNYRRRRTKKTEEWIVCMYSNLFISNVYAMSSPRRSLQAKSNVKCTSFK